MPACFQLHPKGSNEPAVLPLVDEAICEHFGWTPHPVRYVYGWFDIIGFAIAMGRPLGSQELRDYVAAMPSMPEALLCILGYLEQHYTSDGWQEVGRR